MIKKHHVKLLKFPDSVMDSLRKLSKEVSAAFEAFQNQVGPWYTVAEKAYYYDILGKYSLD